MVRSDLFLISNYVHLSGEEYMTLILMIANADGLFIPVLPLPISRESVALKKKHLQNNQKKDNANRKKASSQEQVEMLSFEHCKTF